MARRRIKITVGYSDIHLAASTWQPRPSPPSVSPSHLPLPEWAEGVTPQLGVMETRQSNVWQPGGRLLWTCRGFLRDRLSTPFARRWGAVIVSATAILFVANPELLSVVLLVNVIGVDVNVFIIESATFDQVAGDLLNQISFPAPLLDHVLSFQPAKLAAPIPVPTAEARKFPVLRLAALQPSSATNRRTLKLQIWDWAHFQTCSIKLGLCALSPSTAGFTFGHASPCSWWW